MERRDVLRSIAITGAAWTLNGCNGSREADAKADATLTDADVQRMIRTLTGVEAKPADVAPVRALLASFRFKGPVDPETQPSLMFDPEVDLE